MKSVDVKNFQGGEGFVHFDHILEADEMHGMNRVYAKVTLQSGSWEYTWENLPAVALDDVEKIFKPVYYYVISVE